MTGNAPQCCGRAMTAIGVARADDVQLHTCASCGRHAWSSAGRELSRDELLAALRPQGAAPARRGAKSPVAPSMPAGAGAPVHLVDAGKRAELQTMLSGFTVHGNSS